MHANRRLHSRSRRLYVLLVAVASPSSSQATVVWFEDRFDDSEWQTVTIDGPVDGQSSYQVSDGGNTGGSPDPFREVQTLISTQTVTGHFKPGWTLNPAFGRILSVQFRLDYKNKVAFGQGQGFGLLAIQGGRFFSAGYTISGSSEFSWQRTIARNLRATDFTPVLGGSEHPDFVFGPPITFGFWTGNLGGQGITVGYDNLGIAVRTLTFIPRWIGG